MEELQSWWAGPSEQKDGHSSDAPSFEPIKMDPPEANEEQLVTRRVHILGMGSIGTLIAHSLRGMPHPPPVTLMMHREEMFDAFRQSASVIRLVDVKSDVNDPQSGYDCDVLERSTEDQKPVWRYEPHWEPKLLSKSDFQRGPLYPRSEAEVLPNSDESYIYTIIVTVKAPHTVAALLNVKHRIDNRTTICLMQNGLGQIDELCEEVFTDPATRPTFLIGVISHGCYMGGRHTVYHAGVGVTSLGIYRDTDRYPLPPKSLATTPLSELSPEQRRMHYPTDEELYTASLSSRYLLRTLTRCLPLACAAYPYLDLLQLQLEKLVSNALLNPLTSLYDVPNGKMLDSYPLTIVQNMLLAELSLVIRSLPELQSIPAINERFSSSRLKSLFTRVTQRTAKNSSSMREDIRKARTSTEIDYINGYIVKRGQEVGIQAALNFMIVQMIKAKTLFAVQRGFDEIPLVSGRVEGRKSGEGKRLSEEGAVVLEDVSGDTAKRER